MIHDGGSYRQLPGKERRPGRARRLPAESYLERRRLSGPTPV